MSLLACTRCKISQEPYQFYTQTKRDGSKYTRLVCKTCIRFQQQSHRAENPDYTKESRDRFQAKKQKAVDLFGNKCAHCEQSFPNCVYDFHHVNPDEKEHINVFHRSWKRIQEELAKCIMLCSNCHRIHHLG